MLTTGDLVDGRVADIVGLGVFSNAERSIPFDGISDLTPDTDASVGKLLVEAVL